MDNHYFQLISVASPDSAWGAKILQAIKAVDPQRLVAAPAEWPGEQRTSDPSPRLLSLCSAARSHPRPLLRPLAIAAAALDGVGVTNFGSLASPADVGECSAPVGTGRSPLRLKTSVTPGLLTVCGQTVGPMRTLANATNAKRYGVLAYDETGGLPDHSRCPDPVSPSA
jgi:hypothetical protein